MALSRKLCKLCLFIFNTIFIIAGVAILAVGIWTAADKVYISDIVGTDSFTAAAYMLIVSGVIVIGVCILGFVSLSSDKKILVIVCFVVWVLIFIFLLTGGILAIVFQGQLESGMKEAMKDTLTNLYGGLDTTAEVDATRSWNRVQHDLRCCAVDESDWFSYRNTKWFIKQDDRITKKAYVPVSCCLYDEISAIYNDQDKCQYWDYGPPGNQISGLTNTALYYQGCYEAAKEFVKDSSEAIIIVGFVFGISLIFGLVFTLLYLRQIGNLDDEEIRRRQQSKTPNDVDRTVEL